MTNIQNLTSFDPFADSETTVVGGSSSGGLIHIRIQQRNGRKTLTTLQGLPEDIDQKRLLRAFKKEFACNGTVVADEEMGEVIQLTGDQRAKIQAFLIEECIATKDQVKVHGF
ncbi:Eukaryotic translation initiation factor eIF-1 [Sorochytrium milnesiophthora]